MFTIPDTVVSLGRFPFHGWKCFVKIAMKKDTPLQTL